MESHQKGQASLRRGAGGVVLGVAVVLAGGVGKTGLALGLAGDSVVGDAREAVLALAANTLTKSGISAAGSAVTSGRLAESVVAVEIPLERRPEPTSTVLGSLELKSDLAGGASGLGRLLRRSSMRSALFWSAWSTMDWRYVSRCS